MSVLAPRSRKRVLMLTLLLAGTMLRRPRRSGRKRVVAVGAALLTGILLGGAIAAYGPARAATRTSAHADGAGAYRVEAGETLWHIARDHGVSVDALAQANGISDTAMVRAGQRPTIPAGGSGGDGQPSPGGTHHVAAGETVWGIAGRYGVSPTALASANGLSDPNMVLAGKVLTIPGGGGGASGGPSGGSQGGSPSPSGSGSGSTSLVPRMDHWAAAYGLPADLLKAVTWLESGWQPGVVSPDGAIGVGQLLPETADFMSQRIGVALDPWVADDNIRMSAGYLRLLLDRTGDVDRALIAYYQGLGALERLGPYPSSVHYANTVQSLRSRF